RLKSRVLRGAHAPRTTARERASLSIETPESAPVPLQVLTNRPKDMRSGTGEAIGLGQRAGHGILRRHTLLTTLAIGDISDRPDKHQCPERIFLRRMTHYSNI